MKPTLLLVAGVLALLGCSNDVPSNHAVSVDYLDNTGRADVLSGGVRMIPVETPKGTFRDEPELWDLPRFVEEVEQVRWALGLSRDNFYLYGVSWGGVLAIEYALKYQQHLKGLIISNMMASFPAYNEYAETVLMPAIDQAVLAEIKEFEKAEEYADPRYMSLLMEHYYVEHILRMPPEEWPEPLNRAFKHMNPAVYIPMQGPSELGASGKLEQWDRTADLDKISIPTLVIGAQYDTMDPKHMEWMAGAFSNGRYLYCPDGSHLAMYDDQVIYFDGLIRFIRDVDVGRF